MTQDMAQDGSTMSRQAPLRAAVSYDGHSSMIVAARTFTGTFLRDAQARGVPVAAHTRGDAELVVSELMTNVVRHAPGPCTLILQLGQGGLEIAVSDTSAQEPAPQPFQPQRIGQHGLEIVLALCERLDSEPTDQGKTVRAVIPLD